MALPVLDKTWQFNVNTAIVGKAYGDILFKIKTALMGFGSSPWTIWGSAFNNNGPPQTWGLSNGPGGADLWSSAADVTWNTEDSSNPTAFHSWIVLKQAGLGTDVHICLDCNFGGAADQSYMTWVLFPTGPTINGTLKHRPRASDEIILNNAPEPWGPPIQTQPATTGYVHVIQSTDGECTRIVLCDGYNTTANNGFWLFDKIKNPSSALTNPIVAVKVNNDINHAYAMMYAQSNESDSYCKTPFGTGNHADYYLLAEGVVDDVLGIKLTVADDDTGEWPMYPIDMLCRNTLGGKGAIRGQFYDLWWGSTGITNGDCYPGDGTKQFAQFTHIILPWNGTTPLIYP